MKIKYLFALLLSTLLIAGCDRQVRHHYRPLLAEKETVKVYKVHRTNSVPVAKIINAWLQENGRELGFQHWPGNAAARAPLCNWIVYRRAPAQTVWNNQWMLTAADQVLAEASDGSLLTKP